MTTMNKMKCLVRMTNLIQTWFKLYDWGNWVVWDGGKHFGEFELGIITYAVFATLPLLLLIFVVVIGDDCWFCDENMGVRDEQTTWLCSGDGKLELGAECVELDAEVAVAGVVNEVAAAAAAAVDEENLDQKLPIPLLTPPLFIGAWPLLMICVDFFPFGKNGSRNDSSWL